MLKNGIAWGPAGVHHMLDTCKACGWSRIDWRTLDGGPAMWASRIVRPEFKWDDDSYWTPQSDDDRRLFKTYNPNMTEAARQELAQKIMRWDYSTFDPLDAAVRYGHKIGLQIHAWITINEDDHGWGLKSDFSKATSAVSLDEARWPRLSLADELRVQGSARIQTLDHRRTAATIIQSTGCFSIGFAPAMCATIHRPIRTELPTVDMKHRWSSVQSEIQGRSAFRAEQ